MADLVSDILTSNPISKLVDVAGTLIDRLVPDQAAAAQAKAALAAAAQQAQIDTDKANQALNQTYAQSPSFFLAGARPAAMWLGVAGLAWQTFVQPVINWGVQMACYFSLKACVGLPMLPAIGTDTLTTLLYALLGVSTLRTADKWKGVDTKASLAQMFRAK